MLTGSFLFFLFLAMQGQDNLSFIIEKIPGEGTIIIEHSAEIEQLLNQYISVNKKINTIPGYRIKIYADNNKNAREESLKAQSDFLDAFPEIPTYRNYVAPYFRVYVGNFRTKTDALKELKKIRAHFDDVYIVSTQIDLPKIE